MHKLKYTFLINNTLYVLLIGLFMTGCAVIMPDKNHDSNLRMVDSRSEIGAADSMIESKSAQDEIITETENPGKVQIYSGTGIFVKALGQSESMMREDSSDGVVLNFEGADLREVVKIIVGDLLQQTYSIDPTVKGTINLITSNPIRRDDLLPTLETLLRMNGAAILLEEGIYKVVPIANAVRGSITPQLGGVNTVLSSRGFSVLVAPLKFISASEMFRILEPFASDAASVRIDEKRNLVILSGTQRELVHLRETIEMFDVDWLEGMSMGLFTLQNVDSKTAVTELEVIFGTENQTPVAGLVKLVSIERLNAVLAITSQASYLQHVKLWIDRFDRSAGASGGTRLFIYQVQNGQAEKLADLLNDVFGGKGGSGVSVKQKIAPGLKPVEVTSSTKAAATTGKPALVSKGTNLGTGKEIRIIADKDNNALLILASPSDYKKIELAVRQLDVMPRQVMIDVTIAEVTLTGDLKYGLEWAFTHGNNPDNNVRLDVGAPGIDALVPGFSYLWEDSNGMDAVLNMLVTDSRVTIISSPHVLVVDNQTASINVGDKVPTTSQIQTTASVGIISSIRYIDTGIILSVTPRINAGGLITMEIDQELSSASQTTTSGIDSPTISSRSIKTTVVVKSGETVMLGGLITERKAEASSGIPVLSRIPFLGALFGAQSIDTNRIELVILITPRMVVNSQQAQQVTEEFRKKMQGLARLLDEAGF